MSGSRSAKNLSAHQWNHVISFLPPQDALNLKIAAGKSQLKLLQRDKAATELVLMERHRRRHIPAAIAYHTGSTGEDTSIELDKANFARGISAALLKMYMNDIGQFQALPDEDKAFMFSIWHKYTSVAYPNLKMNNITFSLLSLLIATIAGTCVLAFTSLPSNNTKLIIGIASTVSLMTYVGLNIARYFRNHHLITPLQNLLLLTALLANRHDLHTGQFNASKAKHALAKIYQYG